MKKRNFAKTIGCLLLLGVMSFFMGVFPMAATQANQALKTREGSMSLAYKIKTESSQIPPIDTAAPSIFETASFGLG